MKCKFCKNKAEHKIEYKQKKLPIYIPEQEFQEYEDVSIYVCEDCFNKMRNTNIKVSTSYKKE